MSKLCKKIGEDVSSKLEVGSEVTSVGPDTDCGDKLPIKANSDPVQISQEVKSMSKSNTIQEARIRAREGGNSMTIKPSKGNDAIESLSTFSEQDYEKQHNYVESLKKKGDVGFSLVATEAFVEGMRESGYKTTATAIDEFIDNALQAGAKRIDLIYAIDDKKITDIAVIDDGHGMEPDMIRAAVLWGGTHRLNDRKGFGRYGFGLPSAAVSIAKHYDVYSRTDEFGWHKVSIELVDICAGKYTNDMGIVVAPPAVESKLPKFVDEYLDNRLINHGTIIHLVNPDKLTPGFKKKESFHRKMMEHIGLIYRHVLRTCPIYFNGQKVQPVDPLFLDPNARFYDVGNGIIAEGRDELRFDVKTVDGKESGAVRVRFSLLPPPGFQRNSDGTENKERLGIMKETEGYFIVTRAGRQIDTIRKAEFPKGGFNRVLLAYDWNWAVELDFDPVLDEEFGITVNKQQVTISERIWTILQDQGVGAMVKSLWEIANKLRKEAKVNVQAPEQLKDSESVMSEADKYIREPIKPSPEKEEKAKESVLDEAKRKAKETGRSEEEHVKEFAQDIHKRPYKLQFESREGAPFYRMELFGSQKKLYINTAHKFYMHLYAAEGSTQRLKSSLELLLFVLGACEVEAVGEMELFYQTERVEWSKRLNVVLELLNRKEPVEESDEADESDVEVPGLATR